MRLTCYRAEGLQGVWLGDAHGERGGSLWLVLNGCAPGSCGPVVAEQVVDQRCHVADVHVVVTVAVGGIDVDTCAVVAEQVVDQCRHVADVHIAVAVHVAHDK